jgi:hypothetical protein
VVVVLASVHLLDDKAYLAITRRARLLHKPSGMLDVWPDPEAQCLVLIR